MYSEESILKLSERIGWEQALNSDLGIEVDSDNVKADAGRKVNSFHQLATVENIYSAVSETMLSELDFNAYLKSLREQCVREILTAIIDQNVLSEEIVDYSSVIDSKPRIFDDAIGYSIAIKCLELFVSSARKNLVERNAKLSFQNLKMELEGVRNENGHLVAKGLIMRKEYAIRQAQRILFPQKIIIDGTANW